MVRIIPLADRADAIPQLARWFHDEWGVVDGRPVPEIEQQLRGNLNRDALPMTWLAEEGDKVVGTVSLDTHDLPGFDYLSPWLACLYVVPDHRGQGLATKLVKHVVTEAQRFGVTVVYLWTWNLESYYRAAGWETMSTIQVAGQNTALMRRALNTQE